MARDFRHVQASFKKMSTDWLAGEGGREHPEEVKRVNEITNALQPLINDLREVGILVDGPFDLVMTAENYDEALPVLAKHLPIKYPGGITDGIARAMGTPSALPYWDLFVTELKKASIDPARNGVSQSFAWSLIGSSGDTRLPELIELVRDLPMCSGKDTLLYFLKKYWRRPAVWAFLQEIEHDPDLGYALVPWVQKRREALAAKAAKKPK